jgi:hypothetical protein
MAVPSKLNTGLSIRALDDNGLDANGQGQIRPARNPVQQFLLNVFGGWQANKPQLFKDVPALDMVTPQVAYLTGQGSAEESLAGFGGPASIRGGLQYGRYGRNAVNYGAKQGVQASAKQGQQFIKSQVENVVRNPGKPGTGTPSAPFSFTTQATAQPSASHAFTQLSKAEAGSFMGGLKPGSVEPVIPWATKARVAGIDAVNAVKGAGSKVVTGTKNAASKHVGVPLRNAGNYLKPTDIVDKVILGGGVAAAAGLAGTIGYGVKNDMFSSGDKASTEKKKRDLIYKIPGDTPNPGKTNGPTKVSDTKVVTPGGSKSGNITPPKQNTSTKTKTGTTAPTTADKNAPAKVTPKVPTFGELSTDYSDTMSAADMERVQGNRAGNNLAPIISKNLPTQQTTSLATSHPRVLSPQVSKAQLAADAIFTKGRVMGFKKGGILKVKSNG